VQALDENFMIVRRSANLALSHDLQGFHLYGTDMCLIADVLGRSLYVIDFHLRHKSGGVLDKSFFEIRERLIRKYRVAFRSRWVTTPCTSQFISGVPLLGRLLNNAIGNRVAALLGRNVARLKKTLLRYVLRLGRRD
jgi:hypothetical protein